MTPEKINIAIAELRGLKEIHGLWYRPDQTNMDVYGASMLPNYHGSLDACATFEAGLTDDVDRFNYLNLLNDIANGYRPDDLIAPGGWVPTFYETSWDSSFKHVTSTAPQRCEAFLRVKGKWVEETANQNTPI